MTLSRAYLKCLTKAPYLQTTKYRHERPEGWKGGISGLSP